MKNLLSKKWIQAAGIRAAKTFFQSMAGTLTGATLLTDVDWKVVLSSAAFSAIYSIVTSLAVGLPELKLEEEIKTISETTEKTNE